jgi:type I restriction-modification system DNA methylase subunit/restriction endonuclease S subunit
MDTFENTLNQIREILRKEGITGMDSIKHCLAFTVSRFLTKKNCIKLTIDKKYSFENLMEQDEQKMRELFFIDGDIECIVGQIYDKMKFVTNFKLESPSNLKNILNKIKDINIDELSINCDIVGIIYELHLKTGTSQAMRDLGQYFTNRNVIKYMVELCDPKIKKNGEIETILDPTMGTAGFLAMSIKNINEKNKKVDWIKNKNNIYGFDIDENVKNMAILNLFLETGQIFDRTLTKHDTLHKDFQLSDKTFIDKVDVILANEPFGIKGLKYADCCERIKKLKIDGTKAEPLFLQLMMQSLNKGGRCAVVVPDGVLFNDANLHSGTRKHLCENFNLKKVISLEDGLFLNTGVKSSILFFVNDGETEEVEFCKIKMSNSEIVEESIIKVNIKEVEKNDYSLFVNKYNIVEEEKFEGLEYKKLEELFDFESSKLNSGDMDNIGNYNFYSGIALNPAGKHSSFNFNFPEYIGIIKGGGAGSGKYGEQIGLGKVFYLTEKNAISNGMYILKPKETNNNLKYIYHYLKFSKNKIMDLATYTTGLGNIKQESLKSFQIPLPHLTLQQQIVEALDSIYDTIEGNNKLIKNYEKIKKSIIWSYTLNVEKKKLGDVAEINKNNLTKNYKYKTIKYIDISSVNKGCINIDTIKEFNVGEEPSRAKRLVSLNDILLSTVRPNLENYLFIDNNIYSENLVSSTGFAVITSTKINSKYLYNYITLPEITNYLVNSATGAMYPSVDNNTINNITIPIPSIQIQQHIVKECEYYDNLIDSLKKENERLQNNNIIDMVLKSISKDKEIIIDSEQEDDDEKPKVKIVKVEKPIKNNKKTKNIDV